MDKSKSSMLQEALVILHITAGIYAGACLSVALVDLRFLSSISDTEIALESFSPLLKNMGSLMAPQLVILLLLCVLFSIKAVWLKKPLITHLPLVIYLGVLCITLLVHIPINLEVFANEVPQEKLADVITQWDRWHWLRTFLSILLPGAVVKFYRPLVRAKLHKSS